MNAHEIFMQRCIDLAKNGLGTTYPNPMVGCVIVYNGTIIGEGWHKKAGEPHAEVNAIASVKNQTLLPESTIYVSLEPCSHFGKTPPCANLILDKNIPNIIVGSVDPNEEVAGTGIAKLRAAGRNVIVGVLEKDCIDLNRRFFTFHLKQRPYIILKWAQSADGYIAPKIKSLRKPVWISNAYSRQLTHKWRTEEQAILVGTRTVLDDNPSLTARDWAGKNPVRLVIDKSDKISKESHIFDIGAQTIVFGAIDIAFEKEHVSFEKIDFTGNVSSQILDVLHRRGIQSVIIEGGCATLQSFIDLDLWDEGRIFKSKILLHEGILAPILDGNLQQQLRIDSDELLILRQHDQHNYL